MWEFPPKNIPDWFSITTIDPIRFYEDVVIHQRTLMFKKNISWFMTDFVVVWYTSIYNEEKIIGPPLIINILFAMWAVNCIVPYWIVYKVIVQCISCLKSVAEISIWVLDPLKFKSGLVTRISPEEISHSLEKFLHIKQRKSWLPWIQFRLLYGKVNSFI